VWASNNRVLKKPGKILKRSSICDAVPDRPAIGGRKKRPREHYSMVALKERILQTSTGRNERDKSWGDEIYSGGPGKKTPLIWDQSLNGKKW